MTNGTIINRNVGDAYVDRGSSAVTPRTYP